MNGATFDAGQLIVLPGRAAELGIRIIVSATALAQAMRNPVGRARSAFPG